MGFAGKQGFPQVHKVNISTQVKVAVSGASQSISAAGKLTSTQVVAVSGASQSISAAGKLTSSFTKVVT